MAPQSFPECIDMGGEIVLPQPFKGQGMWLSGFLRTGWAWTVANGSSAPLVSLLRAQARKSALLLILVLSSQLRDASFERSSRDLKIARHRFP